MIVNDEIYFCYFENSGKQNYSKYNINTKETTTIYETDVYYTDFIDILIRSGNLSLYENNSDLVEYQNEPRFVYKNVMYKGHYGNISYYYKEIFDDTGNSVNIPTFYQEENYTSIYPLAIKGNKYYYALLNNNSYSIKKIKTLDLDTKQIIDEIDVNIDGYVSSVFDDNIVIIIASYSDAIYKYNYGDTKITKVKQLTDEFQQYYLANNKLVIQKQTSIEVLDLNTLTSQEYFTEFCQVHGNKLYYLKRSKIETVNL